MGDPTQEEFPHCSQNRDFNQGLLIVCRLIFNNFNSSETVSFCNPAFSNLPKCPMAKNIFDDVSANVEAQRSIPQNKMFNKRNNMPQSVILND